MDYPVVSSRFPWGLARLDKVNQARKTVTGFGSHHMRVKPM
jgi:hypothetical protein